MKFEEKKRALLLRREGYSIKEIAKIVGVAKSSVSIWVRNIDLNEEQLLLLRSKPFTKLAIERRRKSRLINEQVKRDIVVNDASRSIRKINNNQLLLIGTALYWGEGGKTRRTVRIANSDPRIIRVIMRFFREVCNVPEEKFRCHIHIHHHLDHKAAEKYWSKVTNIPVDKFYKAYRKPPKSSQGKKDTLPYGTLDVYVLDTSLFYKIQGWTKGIVDRMDN